MIIKLYKCIACGVVYIEPKDRCTIVHNVIPKLCMGAVYEIGDVELVEYEGD